MKLEKCEATGVEYNSRFLSYTTDGHRVLTSLYHKVGIDKMNFQLSLNDIVTALEEIKQHHLLVRSFVSWCYEKSLKSDKIAFNEIILETEVHKSIAIKEWKKDLSTITRKEHMELLKAYKPNSVDYANHQQGQEDYKKYMKWFQHVNRLHVNKHN